MTSSTGGAAASHGVRMDGAPFIDLGTVLAAKLKTISPAQVDILAQNVLDELVDDVVLDICFNVHRAVKTGAYSLVLDQEKDLRSPTTSGSCVQQQQQALDVFGQVITTSVGVPMLKKQLECVCPNCQRNMAATRFAPHLEKCMGMGRNSSRLASRRLASNSKESYRESVGNEDDDDDQDEDWIEPGRGGPGNSSMGGFLGPSNKRRQRDKNSPRRFKGMGNKQGNRSSANSGETTPREGSITPPTTYDQLSLEERSQWLSTICGVVSSNSKKICTKSTRCPIHTDSQRREVRIKWMTAGNAGIEGLPEDSHVDIDSFTEGDTAALRESLAQLSNASSPAESTVSTSSNPSGVMSFPPSHRRRDQGKRGKKSKSSSKGGSRGSTPPIPFE